MAGNASTVHVSCWTASYGCTKCGGSRIPAPMAVYATPGGGTPQPQQQQQPAQPPVLSESELKQVLHIIIDISSKRSKYFVTAM